MSHKAMCIATINNSFLVDKITQIHLDLDSNWARLAEVMLGYLGHTLIFNS